MGLIVLVGCFVVGFVAFSIILSGGKKKAQTLEPAPASATWRRDTAPTRSHNEMPWYIVLGVAETSSVETVQKAYEQKMQAYHPDQVACFNTGLQQMAEIKCREITEAYERALQLRGIGRVSWRKD